MTTVMERTERRDFTADELRRMRELEILGPDRDGPGRLTVAEYYRLAEAGILGWDERIELLGGEIVHMAPMTGGHLHCVNYFNVGFAPLMVALRCVSSVQNALQLDDHTVLEPDIVLSRFMPSADGVPRPDDVFLVVEVSNTTVAHDRAHKVPAYARAGIPEMWLADVNAQAVDIHTDPVDGAYRSVRRVDIDGILSPVAFPDLRIAVRDIYR